MGIEPSCLRNQDLGKVGVDPPGSVFVGVGQGAAGHATSNPGMIEFGLHGPQAGFDVPQALPVSQLGKRHTEKLVVAGESPHPIMASIPADTMIELVLRKEVH